MQETLIKNLLRELARNISGKNSETIVDILKEKTGNDMDITFKDWRPSDQKVYVSDTTKVKEKLGWEPKISVSQGIQTLMDWAKENKDLFK